MKKQRSLNSNLLNTGFVLCLSAALWAGGCKNNDDDAGDDDGAGGQAGDGDGDGDGDVEPPPDEIYPMYTGPGLQIEILKVNVDEDGLATVQFTLADDAGRALDREGILTEGSISPSFVLSWLGEDEDGESLQYTAYTTREKVPEAGDPVMQSSSDQGGMFEQLEFGKYRYTFGTEIDINEERSHLTHTLGVYARRDFQGKSYVENVLESWVPDGSDVKTMHDVVTDDACNSCHTRLEFHGGQRRGVGMCNLCHTEENSINPESGNTIDFQVMIHKIHMGASLPSVQAGEPYSFVGYMGSVEDFSTVEYPWDMRDCTKCHTGTQGERWITRPTEKPCSSCHDRTYFGEGDAPEGWEKHTGGAHDDSECIVCHGENSLEPISKSHYTSYNNPDLPKVKAEILAVDNFGPGQQLNLEFEVSVNDAPHDLILEPFNRMRLRVWGPDADVSSTFLEEFTAAVECEDTLVRPCLEPAGDGFIYYSAIQMPTTATGTYKVGLDGRYALEGVNYAFENPIVDVAATDDLFPRRMVVSTERCNTCHEHLPAHGGSYSDAAYCLNCHNPAGIQSADDALTPGDEVTLMSINFKDLIHRVHSSVGYPAPLNDCAQCHEEDTTALPLPDDLLPSQYAQILCPEDQSACTSMGGASSLPDVTEVALPAQSAACTSCHNDTAARAHAETNTSAFGEACGTCHGSGKDKDVSLVHEMSP